MAATRIDCDIHPSVGGTRTTLLPYLDDHWKEQVVSRAIDGLDLNSYPPNMPLSGRADWRPKDGSKPASDLAMVQRGAFDQLGASHAICNVVYGAQAVFAHKQPLPPYNFWDPSRVIPSTINEFPYWSFLFADLHAHLIGIPLAALFLSLTLVLISDYGVAWRHTWGRGLALLATFALVLGALASTNLWELPTYFGLGVLAFMVSQYRGKGRINWLLLFGVTIAYLGGAYLLFRPFFHNYKNIGASGVGLVKEGDDLGTWLLRTTGDADAVLAASIFHYRTHTIQEAKTYLRDRGVAVR